MLIVRCFSTRRPVSAPPFGRFALALALVAAVATGARAVPPHSVARLNVSSGSFRAGLRLPAWMANAGCVQQAENRSPDLRWSRGPAGTRAYAVILFDPDAPTGHGFYHWALVDVPVFTTHLPAGAGDPKSPFAPLGARAGQNDYGTHRYAGPCPPPGDHPHRYIFTVDAVDVARLPGLGKTADGPAVRGLLRNHILAEGTLMGRFGR